MLRDNRKKILWVVFDFVQAGGQRYVFEITKALNKEKYLVDFLKLTPMNHDKNWSGEFYYSPTLDLGSKIFLLEEFFPKPKPKKQTGKVMRVINYGVRQVRKVIPNKIKGVEKRMEYSQQLLNFVNQYDRVNFSGINTFKFLKQFLPATSDNFIIHLVTSRFQERNLYGGIDKEAHYVFVSGMVSESIQVELEGFNNYSFTHYNLCFRPFPYEVQPPKESNIFHIAIFTRLSRMKPLDPFFYAVKILLERGENIHLNVYGAGDPEETGLKNQLSYLYLNSVVKFRGHVDDISKQLKENPPHLIWFQSANCQPAGYAALEISMSGLPQIFWDFMYLSDNKILNNVFPSFTELIPFVEYTQKLLHSPKDRHEVGLRQKEYVLNHYSSNEHIHILEELFDN